MLFIAIFVVSLSTLAFEVLLTRVFAIGQWNHLSFMVISIALFGFGASGTYLCLRGISGGRNHRSLPPALSISFLLYLYSICAIFSYLALIHIPLDYFKLPVEPLQSIYLLAVYLGLSLPFFVSGLIIATGYTTASGKAGLVYFASMAGSALGALVPVALLPVLDEGRLIVVATAIPLLPAAIATLKKFFGTDTRPVDRQPGRNLWPALSFATIGAAIYLLTAADPALIKVAPSPYKALGQILQFPASQVTASDSTIRGRIDRVATPYVRFAPGLSLKHTGVLPRQQVIYKDGDQPLVLYDLKNKNDADFATRMLSFAAYDLIGRPEEILLIQRGGGSAVPCALASGAGQITLVEPDTAVANILQQHYPGLRVINRDPRAFLAQSKNRYDIIHIENWGASIPGAAALDQDHTITIEAFGECWKHLTPAGIISISRNLLLPPSDSLRLWSTAYSVIKASRAAKPEKHLALIRNYDTYTLLISKSSDNLKGVTAFSNERNFDPVFLDPMDISMANRFNKFAEPFHYLAINRLARAWKSGRQDEFFNDYLMDVRPRSDHRPFPGRFVKWARAGELYKSLGSRFYVLFLSGEFVVSLVFVEALILASILMFLPVVLVAGKRKKATPAQISYFLGIGAGFMFVELYFIKFFTLIFGDPIISFTTVVAAVLISSSLGGLYVHNRSEQKVRPALFILIGVLILSSACLELATGFLLNLTTIWRYLFSLLVILPVGILIGLPFPLAMQSLQYHPSRQAYAWAVNGCASVLSSIAAAQLAISVGIPAIAIMAVFSYLLALGAARKMADG